MENKIKVSVIVPVYNVEKYVGKCLESLTSQTLQDIEIICINDGSTDETSDILQYFARKDQRIKVIDKKNEGPGIARNLGIDAAQGEYIGFVDPDDWVTEHLYEKMYTQAKKLDSEIVICDYVRYQEWSGKIIPHIFFKRAIKTTKDEVLHIHEGENIDREKILDTLLVSPCYSWNRLYKSSLLKDNQIYFSENRCYEDCPFVLKSHLLANNISYLDYSGYFYRLNEISILRSYDKRYVDYCEIVKILETIITEQNLQDRLALNLSYFKVMNLMCIYNNLPQKEQRHMIKYAKQLLSTKEYKMMRRELKIRLIDRIEKILKSCVSVQEQQRHKVISIFGLKLKLPRKNSRKFVASNYIKIIRKNYKKYPKDTYLLFDCLHDTAAEAIDAYCLFEQMRAQNIPAYYVVRKQTTLYKKLAAENKLDNIIALSFQPMTHPNEFMKKTYSILLRAKAVLTSFDINSPLVQNFFRKYPAWQYICIQHGTIYLKESVLYNNYLYPARFDKILICSDKEERLFLTYGWSPEQLIKVGLPRWDFLSNLPKPQEKSILFMLTWRRFNAVDFESSLYNKNLFNFLHNKKLANYLKQHNITLYFAAHHALMGISKIDINLQNEKNIKVADSGTISQYIKECSCLITDFSSVAFDFMFQNKPVIFYELDKSDAALETFDKEDLAKFDYKKYILPNVCFEENDVVDKIIEYCEKDFAIDETTKQIYNKFFFTKQDIRKQLIAKLEEIA